MLASGSGVFSSLLQLPLEFGETENLPVMDILVNGQKFTFRTAKFVRYLTHPVLQAHAEDFCSHFPEGGPLHCWSRTIGDVSYPGVGPQYIDWSEAGGMCFPYPWELGGDAVCSMDEFLDKNAQLLIPSGTWKDVRFLYTRIPSNHKRFRINGSGADEAEVIKRFDLQRTGEIVPAAKRAHMAWQWFPVALTSLGIDLYKSSWTSLDVDGDLKEEVVMAFATRDTNDSQKHNIYYTAIGTNYEDKHGRDMPEPDGEDHGYNVDPYNRKPIVWLDVIDSQEGDIDTTYNKIDKDLFGIEQPGLLQESSIKSYVPRDEGGGAFVIDQHMSGATTRTQTATQSKTSYDIIERKIRLSNNTGCFCPAYNLTQDNGSLGCLSDAMDPANPSWRMDWNWPNHTPGNKKPPYCASDNLSVKYACDVNVEGEGCCNEEGSNTNNRSTSTCFEYKKVIGVGEENQNLIYNDHYMLYVRSTIASKSGYKTITTEDVETIKY